ncbi:MAG: acyltransferase family protein [Thermoleophilaceae bacterium]
MGTAGVKPGGGRFIAGDPLRGIACLVVLFWHVAVASAGIVPPGGISPGLKGELGSLGPSVVTLSISVWFFFVLSGYLISGPFVRAVVRADGRRPRLGAYARNRVLRIVPGYWAILTFSLLIVGTAGDSLKHIALFYGFAHVYDQGPFTPRMVQAWTLDVEVIFYAAIPLLLLPLAGFLRGRWTPWARASVILAGCAAVAAWSLTYGIRGPTSGLCVPGSLWAFTPGIALATVEPLLRPRFEGRGFGRLAVWALVAVAIVAFLADTYVVDVKNGRQQNFVAAFACGAFLAAPLVLQWTTGGAWRWLDNRFLHWFGVRAYGIYLTHVVAIFELRHLIARLGTVSSALLVVWPLVMVMSTIAGALSYRYIERPFLERRVPWRSSDPAPAPEPEAVAVPFEPAPAPAGIVTPP